MRRAGDLLLLALAGCAAVRGGDAPVTLRLSPRPAVAAPSVNEAIAVASVRARGATGDRRYAYVEAGAPGVLRQAQTLFWEEPPPRIVERTLVAALRGRYAQVYAPDVPLAAPRRLLATLVRFEEEDAGGRSEAVVAIDATMLRAGTAAAAGTFCGRAPIAGASGTERARAFETAVAVAAERLVQDSAGTGC